MKTLKAGLHLNLVITLAALALTCSASAAQPEVLIKWRHPSDTQRQSLIPTRRQVALQRLGAEFQRPVGDSGWDVVALPEGTDARAWLSLARRDPAVAHAELNWRYHALATVNDRLFPRLHGLTQIGAPTAWDSTTGSSDVVVAVFDTGINLTHPDLAPVLWVNSAEVPGNGIDDDSSGVVDDVHGADFVDNDGDPSDDAGHGSHVAGIIAAAGNNRIGIAGVAYGCRILPIRILSADGSAISSDIVRAFDYVRALKARGVNVRLLNHSWGGEYPSFAIFEAIAKCADAGILSVCAAGNDYRDTDLHPSYPAAYDTPGVLSVAASDACDLAASFSNFGRRTVHLAAPGTSILSCWGRGHDYSSASGTSMATPHVTGAAALLLSRQPSLTLPQLRALILSQADAQPAWTNRTATGARLNVAKAMTYLNSGQTVPTNDPPNSALTNSPRRIVSRTRTGGPARDVSYTSHLGSSVSENGRYVVFLSYDTNLVAGDVGGFLDVFIRDTVANTNGRVSQTSSGIGANANCSSAVISRDGNYVAFVSIADNLVSGDTDGALDVFLWERATRNLRLISFDLNGAPFTQDADSPSISDDGAYVAFAADFWDGADYYIRDIYVWRKSDNTTQIINVKPPSTYANDWSDYPRISGDGRYVAYHTWANNLVTGDNNGAADVHVFDRNNSTTTRVSRNAANQQANSDSYYPILSGDGRYVAFLSAASNLGQLPSNGVPQNYLHDRNTGQLYQLSLDSQGAPLSATNYTFDVSHDGRFVILTTDSEQLPPAHGYRTEQPYLYDRLTGFLNVVGLNDGGFPADDGSYYPSISATGEWVAFCSWANTLVAPDGNNLLDVILWRRGTQLADLRIRTTGQTSWTGAGVVHPLTPQRVPASGETNGISRAEAELFNVGLSSTTFQLRATVTPGWQLTAQKADNSDVTSSLLAGTLSSGSLTPGSGYLLRLSLNRTNAFAETVGAVRLAARVSGATNELDAVTAVATRTLSAEGLRLASRANTGEPALLGAFGTALDGNGQRLAFASASDNLVPHDENFSKDIFVQDTTTGQLTRASTATDGTPGNGRSYDPFLSRTGGLVAFQSDSDNLVPVDENMAADIFIKNLQTGATELASLGFLGNSLSRGSENPSLSADGRYVLFDSIAPNAVPSDTNGCMDVFLRDRQTGAMECVSQGANGQWGNADSTAVAMTPDARFILFLTHATNLAATDTNQFPDLYLRDRTLNRLELISGRNPFDTANGPAITGSLSDDGRFVTFRVDADDVLPGASQTVFLLDRDTGVRTPIVPEAFGLPANTDVYSAKISPDGALLALVAGVDCGSTNSASQIWLTPRTGGAARLMSATRAGTPGVMDSYSTAFSSSGRQFAFVTPSSNLLSEPWPDAEQVYLQDTTELSPDAALAHLAQGPWRGTGEIGTNQTTIEQPLAFNTPRDFYLRVTDFSGAGGPVVVAAPTGNGTQWSVRYFNESNGSQEITSSMAAGWTFDPGTSALDLRLRVRVTILSASAPASFTIAVRSANFPTLQDNLLVALVQDSDNDGISDSWERSLFNNSLTTANATTDFDGDGAKDLQEYFAGTDPKSPASVLRLNWLTLGGTATFSLTSTHTNRFYRLEATPALDAAFTARNVEQLGNGGTLILQDNFVEPGTNAFYRARAELP